MVPLTCLLVVSLDCAWVGWGGWGGTLRARTHQATSFLPQVAKPPPPAAAKSKVWLVLIIRLRERENARMLSTKEQPFTLLLPLSLKPIHDTCAGGAPHSSAAQAGHEDEGEA